MNTNLLLLVAIVLAMVGIATATVSYCILSLRKEIEDVVLQLAGGLKRISDTLMEHQAAPNGEEIQALASKVRGIESEFSDLHQVVEKRFKRMVQERRRAEEARGEEPLILPDEDQLTLPGTETPPQRKRARRRRR